MKKLLLLVIAFLPVFGFGQVDLASWNLTTNANVSASQTYVTATAVSFTGSNPSYSSGNLDVAYFNDGSLSHYRFFQITIKPTTGNSLNLSRLKFEQQRLNSGSTYGPSHYGIKYYISNNGSIPDDYNFFVNNSTWLVNEETIAGNTVKDVNLSGITLTATQTLVLRFYARSGDYNLPGWRIKANTLKITGTNPNATPPKPVAVDDTANIPHNNTATAIDVLINDTYNNLTPTINFTQNPTNGTLSINGSNQVVFTPTNGFTGSDTFKYTLTNANGTSTTAATVTVNVGPRANNDTATAIKNVATTINVLSNDVTSGAATINITQQPANGTATVNAGQIVYTSVGGFTGSSTIKYTITSAHGTSNEATVTVNVVPPVPVAVNDAASTLQNQAVTVNVLNNDTINGLPTTINLTQGSGGTAALNSNQVVFTPTAGFLGNAIFTYTLTNANGTSSSATVTISVTAPIAPTAVADSYPVNMTVSTDLNVLSNDNLGSATSITSITPTAPAHGTVTVNANNTIRYTPTAGYAGSDSFSYSFSTAYGTTAVVAVTILVQPQTPTAGPLCGTYYVGTGGHFTTITQAVNYANANGINCNVIFLLTNSNYTRATGESFPIIINEYAGATSYTLTIQPSDNATNVQIKAESYDAGNNNWVFPIAAIKYNKAKNVIVDGKSRLTISNLNTSTTPSWSSSVERNVIWFASTSTSLQNGANNNTLKNLKIEAAFNGLGQRAVGIRATNTGLDDDGVNSNNTVDGVSFKNCTHGVYVLGNGATGNNQSSNWVIKNNDFDTSVNSPFYGFYLRNVRNFEISYNEIIDVYTTSNGYNTNEVSGIHISGSNLNYSSGKIFNNRVLGIYSSQSSHQVSGIYIYGKDIDVYNNFVNNIRSVGNSGDINNGYLSANGIYVRDASNLKLYHNSVRLLQGGGGFVNSALFIANGSNLDVRNNIFGNHQTAGPTHRFVIFVNNATVSNLTLDYNNYHSLSNIGATGSPYDTNNIRATFQDWKNANPGKDAHSTNITPVFLNPLDLHLVPDAILNVQHLGGVALTSLGFNVSKDIDDQVRYIPRPTMGADEIAETHCTQVVTWNGTSWNPAQPAGWIGDENVKIVIAGPYPMGDANLLKSCQLEIGAGAVLTIGNGSTYIVEDKLTLKDGSTMIVEDNGSFVQVSEPDVNDIHPGAVFQVHRKSATMYRYDFTYWSSPVEGFRLKDVSPLTLFDKFYSWNAQTGTWTTLPQPANSTTLMETGVGYIVRAPQNYSTNPSVRATWESIFKGKPNNGAKQVTVANGADNKWNLIGNPYPSAIDIDVFMNANANVVEGAIYLWTHNSAIVPTQTGGQIYTYSASDYVTVNAAGMVVAGPQNNALGANNGDDFKIASGQSFFVKGKVSNANGNQVVFNNSMRVKQAGQNDQFLRPSPAEPNQNWETTGKHRVWLNLTGANDAFNQALVGYIENATDGLDSRYDADVFSGGTVSLYSLLDTKKLTIQGRALPFNNQDEVPMGYKTTLTGTLKIAIDHFDGLFQGQDIYLEDKVLNIVHNLKDADYTFTTVPGTFNERFVLRYVPAAELGIDNPTVDANSVIVFRNGSQIDIKSKDQSIEHVTVYDLLGKVIFDKDKINTQSFSTTQLNASNQVVIVKIITDTQAEVVKKVIMN